MTCSRRSIMATLAMLGVTGPLGFGAPSRPRPRFPVALFEKPLEHLPMKTAIRILSDIGFDGIEATVRRGGRIAPERVKEELPPYVETLGKAGLKVLVMATDIRGALDPHAETTLRTAAQLGIRTYRLGGETYDPNRPLLTQLKELELRWADLGALNRELGLTALYQNHAGSRHVGAAIWDLHRVLERLAPDEFGVAFDIRHAVVEGTSSWSTDFQLLQPWIRAVYVKDFVFEGARARNVPMGDGVIGEEFYRRLKAGPLKVPVSLHCPHLQERNERSVERIVRRDYTVLKRWIG